MNWKIWLQFLGLACFLLLLDALLKAYVHENIPEMHGGYTLYPYEGIGVFRNFHGIEFAIVHVKNYGAILGLFSHFPQLLLYGRIALIGGLLTYLFFVPGSIFMRFSLLLIATGAIGNVLDYFIYGHVVDMFHFTFFGFSYPVFNLADSTICIGILLLLFNKFLVRRHVRSPSTSR